MKRQKVDIKKIIKKKIEARHQKLVFIDKGGAIKDTVKKPMNERVKQRVYGIPVKLADASSIHNIDSVFDKTEDLERVPLSEKREPLSIVVTAYQTQNFIQECLDSIENQTYFENNNEYEILVGLDACQDTLNELLKIRHKYRNLRIFMMDSNMGTYVTTNTLLDIAKYENILRFDSDDIMMPEMVNEVMHYSYNYDVVQFRFSSFTENIKDFKNNFKYVAAGAIFFKKSVLEKAGGYRNWECAADSEFVKRITNFVLAKKLKKRLFYRRSHSNSLTNRIDTNDKSKTRKEYLKLIRIYHSNENIKIDKVVNTYIEINKSSEAIYQMWYKPKQVNTNKMFDVIIPHSNIDGYRTRNLSFIVKHYKEYLPDSNIIIVEQNTETDISEIADLVDVHLKIKMEEKLFCKSFLLNEGFNIHKSKYLIFADTDCVVHKDVLLNLKSQLELLDKVVVLPYNRPVFNLNEAQTLQLIQNYKSFNYGDLGLIRRACFSNGGVVIISAENYYNIGGHDPRFVGWGAEDDAFYLKAGAMLGIIRLNYDLLHLNHPKGAYDGTHNPFYTKNHAYYKEYLNQVNIPSIVNNIGFNHLKK